MQIVNPVSSVQQSVQEVKHISVRGLISRLQTPALPL